MENSAELEFWEKRYRAGRTPWDLGGVPAALIRFLAQGETGRVLLPGCGSGYEGRAFAEAGWATLAIDYSPAALERAQRVLAGSAVRLELANFFTDELPGPFDVIYERTFLCSMPPERWPAYAARMSELLRPGARLAGIFAFGREPEPPPYLITTAEIDALLGATFELAEDQPIPGEESLPLFAGMERWQVWRRR